MASMKARRFSSSASTANDFLPVGACTRSEEHTSELQSRLHLVCRLLLAKKRQPMTGGYGTPHGTQKIPSLCPVVTWEKALLPSYTRGRQDFEQKFLPPPALTLTRNSQQQ